MPSALIFAATYAFAAAVQPGQFLAYLISQAMANGWRRTVPAVFAPLLSDVPIVGLVLLVLTQVPPLFVVALRVVGGLFLLYLAWDALQTTRHYREALAASPAPVHRTVLNGALVNLFNPNPYLGWALVMGPQLIEAWRRGVTSAIALLAIFYLVLIVTTAAIVLLFSAARTLGPHVARVMVGVSAAALAAFGLYQLWAGAATLLPLVAGPLDS